ncbi:hypothetical protein [Primorskyibacter sp. 2E233]|uniref:hypothetical protein n=1 Tax=Primorskyibacter sp. 2E233 TaxID=3413431 RepID=UPI003BF2EF01
MRGTVLGLVMGGCAIARCLAPAGAEAGSTAAPVIHLECEIAQSGGKISAEMLCEAMQGSLARVAPEVRTEPAAGGSEASLVLAVQVTKAGQSGLTGHLQWHSAKAPGLRNSPDVQFSAMDAQLNSAMLGGFTDALIAADPGFLAVLDALRR